MKHSSLSLALLCLLCRAACAADYDAPSWGPWDSAGSHAITSPNGEASALAISPFTGAIVIYQKLLAGFTSVQCIMIPHCSRYGLEAIRLHGPWAGMAMTVDRLLHEGSVRPHVPVVVIDGQRHYLDPVSANDTWWARP